MLCLAKQVGNITILLSDTQPGNCTYKLKMYVSAAQQNAAADNFVILASTYESINKLVITLETRSFVLVSASTL